MEGKKSHKTSCTVTCYEGSVNSGRSVITRMFPYNTPRTVIIIVWQPPAIMIIKYRIFWIQQMDHTGETKRNVTSRKLVTIRSLLTFKWVISEIYSIDRWDIRNCRLSGKWLIFKSVTQINLSIWRRPNEHRVGFQSIEQLIPFLWLVDCNEYRNTIDDESCEYHC